MLYHISNQPYKDGWDSYYYTGASCQYNKLDDETSYFWWWEGYKDALLQDS